MVRRFGLGDDPALRTIAEIVHDIDLKDGKFNRLEAVGLAAVIDGMVEHVADDRERIRQCGAMFDALHTLYGKRRSTVKAAAKTAVKASARAEKEARSDDRKRTAQRTGSRRARRGG
jgi:hypothetical protein